MKCNLLRLVFNNVDGICKDITMPIEKWIRDWWYECNFVPENGEIPTVAELNGEDILKYFPDYANTFEDIAYAYGWDEFHDDYFEDTKYRKEDNGDLFEKWLIENVKEYKLKINIANKSNAKLLKNILHEIDEEKRKYEKLLDCRDEKVRTSAHMALCLMTDSTKNILKKYL